MLYDKLKDLALEFGNAIVREALKEPLGQLEELMRDRPFSTAPTAPSERAHVVSRPKSVFRGKRLVVPPTVVVPSSLAPTVTRPSPPKKKKTRGSAVKTKQKPVARPAKLKPPTRTLKTTPAAVKALASAPVASDDAVLKHLPKGKPVRSDKLKTKTGLGTDVFAKRVEDLMRRGVVVRRTQGTHRYYVLT